MAKPISRSLLEQMDTEQLDELLREYTQSPENGSEELCFMILDIIEQREKQASTGRLPDTDRGWQDFQTYYLETDEPLYPLVETEIPKPKKQKQLRLRRILLAAALVAILATFLIPPAFGYQNILQMIGQWTDDTFRFVPSDGGNASTVSEEFSDLRNYADSMLPTWVPEGYSIEGEPAVGQTDCCQCVTYIYTDTQGNQLMYDITLYASSEMIGQQLFEKSTEAPEQYISNGRTFYILQNGIDAESVMAICVDGLTVLTFSGEQLTKDNSKAIIDSIGG